MPTKLPAKLAERGLNAAHARAINQLSEAIRKQQLVALPGQAVVETANGTSLKITAAASDTQGDAGFFY